MADELFHRMSLCVIGKVIREVNGKTGKREKAIREK